MSDLDTPTPMGSDTAGTTDNRYMSLRWQDDRQTWSNERIIDLGQTGNRFPTIRFHRLGVYRSRQWELVCTATVLQCIVAMEEDAEVAQ